LEQARAFARTMSDSELVEETSKSLDDLSHSGWQAIHEEVSRRGLRVRPWRNESFVLVTTVNKVSGHAVHQTMDVVAAEYVLALSFARDLGAGVTDVVDGRSTTAQEELRDARRVILKELKEQARQGKADAVIDVRFSYGEVPGPGKRLLMVAGVGTAVQLTRLPGAPIRDVAGDVLPVMKGKADDLPGRAAHHHPPRFPGITDSARR
jgi:uncharacterized protein YbjQ (UPF0145 family)